LQNTYTTLTVINAPGPREPNNPNGSVESFRHLAQPYAVYGRTIPEQPSRPGINGRLASLVAGLLEERNQCGSTSTS
jgi:hypothetical protein